MGRNNKKGLNYFTLDVSFSDSIKLASIEAGNNAISVLIELWQKIYGSHGYYMDFEEDHKLLFISSALTKITIDELDKLRLVNRLFAALEKGESSARQSGWIPAKEVESALGL